MKAKTWQLVSLVALALASVIFGSILSIYFQFGQISVPGLVSVITSANLGSPAPATILNFAFFISLSFFVAAWLSSRWNGKFKFIWASLATILASIGLFLFATSEVAISALNVDRFELQLDDSRSGVSVVHVFVESWGPNQGLEYLIEDAEDFVPASKDSIVGTIEVPPNHGNTILGLLSSWCGQKITETTFTDIGDPRYGMQGEYCLHDNLKKRDFSLHFLTGYNSGFQSKDLYLTNKDVIFHDLDTWKTIEDPKNLSAWRGGLNDAALLKNLTSKSAALFEHETPFYIAALTLDTHDLYPPLTKPPYCPEGISVNKTKDLFQCVSIQLQEMTWILQEAVPEDGKFLIVLQGDHPSPVRLGNQNDEIFFWAACVSEGKISPVPEATLPESSLQIANFISDASHSCHG